jgi:hypothetical protein
MASRRIEVFFYGLFTDADSADLCDVRRASCGKRGAPAHIGCNPAKIATILTSFFSLQAPQHHSRTANNKKLKEYWHADETKTPVKSATYCGRICIFKRKIISAHLSIRPGGLRPTLWGFPCVGVREARRILIFGKSLRFVGEMFWSGRRDLNSGPPAPKAPAENLARWFV